MQYLKIHLYIKVVILLTATSSLVFAQAPDTLWTKTYGGSSNEEAYSVQQTTDGGYIITGYTKSFADSAGMVYLVKTNSGGDTLWTKMYGGSNYDEGQSVKQTFDGGYIVAGNIYVQQGGNPVDFYLIKTDSSGDTLWTKTYGGSGGDVCYSVQQTSDSGYIMTGYTHSFGGSDADVYLVKTNSGGDTLWTKTYWTDDSIRIFNAGYSVQQTTDGGYIIAGKTIPEDTTRGYCISLIKTDSSGDTLWTKIYGDGACANDVKQTIDGGYIVTGCDNSNQDEDIILLKTDSDGDSSWIQTFGGNSNGDQGQSVQQTSDGGYIVAGHMVVTGRQENVYVIKTDSSGQTLWTKSVGSDSSDVAFSVQQTFDGGYIIAGYTRSYGAGALDMYLIRIGPDGLTSDDSLALAYNGNRHLVRQPNSGNMHLVYTSGGNIVYVSSTNYGVDWTLPYTLGMGEFPAIALTPLGKPCVTWTHDDTLWFSKKNTTWSSTSYFVGNAAPYHPAIVVTTPDEQATDTVHIMLRAWYDNPPFSYNTMKEISFPFSSPSTSTTHNAETSSGGSMITLDFPSISADYNNTLHATWMHGDTVYYGTRAEGGSWSVWGNKFSDEGLESAHTFPETYGDSVFIVWQNEGDDEVYRGARHLQDSTFHWTNLSHTSTTPSIYPVNTSGMVSTFVDKSSTSDSLDIFWRYDSGGSLHNISSTSNIRSLYPQTDLQILSPPPHYQYTAWQEGNSPPFVIEFEKVTINPRPAPAYFVSINGGEVPSLHLVERDTFISDWQIPVDIGDDNITYEFPLEPGYHYKLKAVAYHESSGEWREWVTIDNGTQQLLKYNACEPETLERWIPPSTYQDSTIEISFNRIAGDYATAGPVFIYRYEQEETESAGGYATSTSSQKECLPSMGIASLSLTPNPFNKNLSIKFHVLESHNTSIRVYDITGRLVKIIYQGKPDGIMQLQWDNTDEDNKSVSQGIYFIYVKDHSSGKTICEKVLKIE